MRDLARVLGVVDPNDHDVLIGLQRLGDVDLEREVATAVVAAFDSVDVDRGVVVDRAEPKEGSLSVGNGIDVDRGSVPRDPGVISEFVEFLPRRGHRNRESVTVVGPLVGVVPLVVDPGISGVSPKLPAPV